MSIQEKIGGGVKITHGHKEEEGLWIDNVIVDTATELESGWVFGTESRALVLNRRGELTTIAFSALTVELSK